MKQASKFGLSIATGLVAIGLLGYSSVRGAALNGSAPQSQLAAIDQAASPTASPTPLFGATETSIPVTATPYPTEGTQPPVRLYDFATPTTPQPTAIPSPAPRVHSNGYNIINILLAGSDSGADPSDPSFRTDSMVIVSINQTTNTVSMLSIPRDLYVYIPTLGMQRVNVAYDVGEIEHFKPDGGFGLLQQTILYNFGIPVNFYALINFDGFKQIVDSVNGVDVAVDCPVSDLRFQGPTDPSYTPQPSDYKPYTLVPGFYHMNGSLALWYSRMRHSSSDFDRGRRQQQVLRAIWQSARAQGLLSQAPQLWTQLTKIVKTNLTLGDVIPLIPMALNLSPTSVTDFYMGKGLEMKPWQTPLHEDVQLPDPQGFFNTINRFYTPPTINRLNETKLSIAILNGSGHDSWDIVAADKLTWAGFAGQAQGTTDAAAKTVVYDYTGNAQPALLAALLKSLAIKQAAVVSQPDPNRTVDFKIVLGADFKICTEPGYG